MAVVPHACDTGIALRTGALYPRRRSPVTADRVDGKIAAADGDAETARQLQGYLRACGAVEALARCYAAAGVPVFEVHYGNMEEVLAGMHDHVLACIEESFSLPSPSAWPRF
jgi:hypothetical protein